MVSTHSRPKAAGNRYRQRCLAMLVSTHSRPKAAGGNGRLLFPNSKSFNTQPPEGGWMRYCKYKEIPKCFNTQPPEGGWQTLAPCKGFSFRFQHTAARRRLGGRNVFFGNCQVFQHTAARRRLAGCKRPFGFRLIWFQHTAARRRLAKECSIGLM